MLKLYFFAEGLAVGVGFGAIGKTAAATFENARYIKILIKLYYSKCKSISQVPLKFSSFGNSTTRLLHTISRNLAIGIGIQNFPEGLAVSLPLRGAGFSSWKSFW